MIDLRPPKMTVGNAGEVNRYLIIHVQELQYVFNQIEDTQTALKNEIAGLKEEIKKLKEAQL